LLIDPNQHWKGFGEHGLVLTKEREPQLYDTGLYLSVAVYGNGPFTTAYVESPIKFEFGTLESIAISRAAKVARTTIVARTLSKLKAEK
jgi:hypothetical protein